MNRYKLLLKNSWIFAIGNLGSRFITLLMLPFYTRLLSQSEYGQIDIITTTTSLLLPIFTVNIVEAVVRFSLDKKKYTYEQVLTNSLVFILIGSIVLIIAYPIIGNIDAISEYKILFLLLFITQAIHTSIKQFARSMNLTTIYMISDLLYTLVFVISNVIFLSVIEWGINGYLIAMIIAYSIDLIFISININVIRYIKLKSINNLLMKNMLIYCLPLIPNSLMWWIMNVSDRFIIMEICGLSAAGIYSVANKLPTIISNLYNLFFKAWQISAIEAYDSDDRDKFYSNVFQIFFFLMMILASIYLMFNKMIIKILVGENFYSAWKYAPILVVSVIFSSFSGFLGTNYTAGKNTKGAFYTSLAGAIVNFILNIILIPKIGLFGASIGTMIGFATMWILRIFDTKKIIKICYPTKKMLQIILIIYIQIFIGYLNLEVYNFTISNLILFVLVLIISKEYIKPLFLNIFKYIIIKLKKITI